METKMSFGEYVRQKRLDERITLRKLAARMEFSAGYWSDIENGKRNPPDKEKLEELCEILELTEAERYRLFDLATVATKGTVVDLADYILKPPIRRALRLAQKLNLSDEGWDMVTDNISKMQDSDQ